MRKAVFTVIIHWGHRAEPALEGEQHKYIQVPHWRKAQHQPSVTFFHLASTSQVLWKPVPAHSGGLDI